MVEYWVFLIEREIVYIEYICKFMLWVFGCCILVVLGCRGFGKKGFWYGEYGECMWFRKLLEDGLFIEIEGLDYIIRVKGEGRKKDKGRGVVVRVEVFWVY